MKPIAILQFSPKVGPGYFAEWLAAQDVPTALIRIDQGEAVPHDIARWGGLGLLGGPMSVNDSLSWIPPVLDLVRLARDRDVPVIGHCLGGQLLARALDASVTRSPQPEIGWVQVTPHASKAAEEWLGETGAFPVFQWHNETFDLPTGAEPLFASPWCANQAYVIGPHLGLQCHTEITAPTMERWCADWFAKDGAQDGLPPSVQTPAQMRLEWALKLQAMRQIADHLYSRWLDGVRA